VLSNRLRAVHTQDENDAGIESECQHENTDPALQGPLRGVNATAVTQCSITSCNHTWSTATKSAASDVYDMLIGVPPASVLPSLQPDIRSYSATRPDTLCKCRHIQSAPCDGLSQQHGTSGCDISLHTKARIGWRGCRHIHLAYVPLMRRDESTCT